MDVEPQPSHERLSIPDAAATLLETAKYMETILATELTWITHRLTWLFVSQSFCLTTYTILMTTTSVRADCERQVFLLRLGIPAVALLCCAAAGLGANAAGEVAALLADERARMTKTINEKYGTHIPLVGISRGLRDPRIQRTIFWGSLPRYLPWLFFLFWIVLLVRLDTR